MTVLPTRYPKSAASTFSLHKCHAAKISQFLLVLLRKVLLFMQWAQMQMENLA